MKWFFRLFYDDQLDYGIEPTANLTWKKRRFHYGMGLLGPAVYQGLDKKGELIACIKFDPFNKVYIEDGGKCFYDIYSAKEYCDDSSRNN